MHKYDVAIIGGGIAGMATALRLQAAGRSTLILESHGHPGGCAGYFSKRVLLLMWVQPDQALSINLIRSSILTRPFVWLSNIAYS